MRIQYDTQDLFYLTDCFLSYPLSAYRIGYRFQLKSDKHCEVFRVNFLAACRVEVRR
jgi:hypothetical protein